MDLFRTANMRKITILISILYMLISLEFDATVRNIANLDFNIYMSFMISAALELPADLLSIVGLNYLGRRWSSSVSLLACGVCILPCAWLTGCIIFLLLWNFCSPGLKDWKTTLLHIDKTKLPSSVQVKFKFSPIEN